MATSNTPSSAGNVPSTSKSNIELAIVPILVGLVLTGALYVYRYFRTVEAHEYANSPAGLMELQIELNNSLPKPQPGPLAPTVKATQVVDGFQCPTIEIRDAGFLSAKVQYLEMKDTTYIIPRGCTVVTLKGDALRSLSRMQVNAGQSGEYLFRFANASSPTGYTGCGKMLGLNDPPAKCLNFLRENQGRVLEVINPSEQIIID